jgi:8-oxo-dGTP pyrophosphatase MutT (NUDIX family)
MVGDNWGSSASGMLVTDGERVLLLKRSSSVEDPNLWGIPGGAIPVDYDTHKRKDAKRSALDEAREEMGGIPSGSVIGKHVFRKPSGFSFTTFVWETDPESLDRFTPRLNWEHTDWDLFDLDGIKPRGIHPGVIWVLKRMGR